MQDLNFFAHFANIFSIHHLVFALSGCDFFITYAKNRNFCVKINEKEQICYSCNKITKTWIQISRLYWFWFFLKYKPSDDDSADSNIFLVLKVTKSHEISIKFRITDCSNLSDNVQMLIFCLSYFITTVPPSMCFREYILFIS